MKFYRRDLLQFNYTDDKVIKLLVPYVMIETAKQVYGELSNEVEISICGMWHLVTKGKKSLAKREREKLVALFNEYLDYTVEYETDIKFDIVQRELEQDDDNTFIMTSLNDIAKIFIETTMAKLPKQLINLLNIQSYFNGKYIYYSLEDLVLAITKQHESQLEWLDDGTLDLSKAHLWLYHFKYNELEELASKFVAYPNVDQLLTKRFNSDNVGLDKQYLANDNFNEYIAELETLGIICKVPVKYGSHGRKAVFCRVEHKPLCVALYNRMEQLKQMAKKYKEQNEVEDVKEEVPTKPIQKENYVSDGKRVRPRFR